MDNILKYCIPEISLEGGRGKKKNKKNKTIIICIFIKNI